MKFNYIDQYDDNGDKWIVAKLTIFTATVNDSGCYHCLAANFEHTDTSSSSIVYVQSKFAFAARLTIVSHKAKKKQQ